MISSWLSDRVSRLPSALRPFPYPPPYPLRDRYRVASLVRGPDDLPLKDFRWKTTRNRCHVDGRFVVMMAVEDSRMYQNVQSEPKGSLKL